MEKKETNQSTTPGKIKILFLAANPAFTEPLKIDEEIRMIEGKIRAAEYRDSIELKSAWAVRPDDLQQILLEHKPHIVHFSGHGAPTGELILLDKDRNPKPVKPEAIQSLFTILKDNIRIVFFNACYTEKQARAINEVIDCVIGMNTYISDQAATVFAASFYRALGFGRSIKDAFELGKTALQLEGIPGEDTPKFLTKAEIYPSKIFLYEQSQSLISNNKYQYKAMGQSQKSVEIKILHLSDLHFDSAKPKDTQIILDALWKDLDNFKDIDFILFSGDLVKAGDKKDEFEKAFQIFIKPLLEKTNLDKESFFIAPGNHDIQKNAIDDIIEDGLKTKLIDRESLNSFLDIQLEKKFTHIERLDHFNNFKTRLNTENTITSNKLFSTHKINRKNVDIGIACLNSCWRATGIGDGHDRDKLLIGERQIDASLNDLKDCDIKIAMYHHSLDWLNGYDQNDSKKLLSREFDFIFCGHLHDPNLELVNVFNNKAMLIQGGCLYHGRSFYNGYSVVCFNVHKGSSIIYLRSYFDDRREFDKAVNKCKDGEMSLITKKEDDRGDNFKNDDIKKAGTILSKEKDERESDQVKGKFKWLLEIKNTINLSEELESLGSDEYNGIAEKFIKHSDIKNPLALESLARKIRKRSCVIAFVGPQLCGKSWLARNVCRFIAPNVPVMQPEVIVHNDIKRIMDNLRNKGKFKDANGNDEDILSRVRYRILAIWARRLVENSLRYGLKHEEFLELRRNDQNDDLINFTEDLDFALDKLVGEKDKGSIFKTSKDFTIFECCINKLLPPNLEFKISNPHVLAVEIEDLHDYEKTTSPKTDSGKKFISHFWENLKSSVNDLEYNKEKKINRKIGIIVTTRQPEFIEDEEEENTETDLILKIADFPKIACQKYAKEMGLEKLLGTQNLEKVTEKAFQFSKCYVWFYVRFLRSVVYLYINTKENKINVSIEQIIDAVLSLPVFWYWKAPWCEDFRNIVSRCLAKDKRYPRNIPDYSAFLYNIINTYKNNARLINFYKRCLEYPQTEMSESDIKELLLPLLRLGLLRRDDLNQTFVPWNEIIRRHFSPDHLLNLSIVVNL